MHLPTKLKIWFIPILLAVLSAACSLPGSSQPTIELPPIPGEVDSLAGEVQAEPTQPPLPTPTQPPLPPVLVEVDPPLGSDFPLQGPLTLYFNQPMDKPSVEIALTGQPALSGRFKWENDSTVVFEPDAPYPAGTDLEIIINTTALSSSGLFLPESVRLSYRVVPPLMALQVMPALGLLDADPASAVAVTFSQPVVSIGTDQINLPDAFTIHPEVPGKGEWVNTSTYIFYPDPSLAGGIDYTVLLNQDLHSTAGAPLVGLETYEIQPFEWTFSTTSPRLVSIEPGNGADAIPLSTVFNIEFSQAMDAASVEEGFSLYETNRQAVPGEFGWSEDFTTLIFTPTRLLARATYYDLVLLGSAQARGGTPLGVDNVARVGTVPDLGIVSTEPVMGGVKTQYANLVLHFNGPAEMENPLDYFTFSPEVSNLTHWWNEQGRSLYIHGDFKPLSAYTATLSGAYPDPWGGKLGEKFIFRFSTGALEPNFFVGSGETSLFTIPNDATITAQATNIDKIGVRLGSVTFDDLVRFTSPGGFDLFNNFKPADQENWTYDVGLSGDQNHVVRVPITRQGTGLDPGIYHLEFFIPELTQQPLPYLIISSNVQLTLKLSTTSAFVWAVDLRTQQPVSGVPVAVFDSFGNRLSSGVTDALGVFQSPISTQPDLFTTYYAVMSDPSSEFFSISLSNWSLGIEAYDFGFNADFTAPHLVAYLYTDRPIYQPGQKVYFRGIVRHEHNGRYAMPDLENLPVTVSDGDFTPILNLELPVSEFGTVHGSYLIPEDSQPGQYQISTAHGLVSFQVAEYRVSEIDLDVDVLDAGVAGQPIHAQVNACYFFGSPASDVPLTWNIYRRSTGFYLPGYQVGTDNYQWLEPPWHLYTNPFGEFVTSGESNTEPDGKLNITMHTDPQAGSPTIYTLEVTIRDESGFPVSAHTEITVHPSDFYIGVRPDTWVGQAGTEVSFEVKGVDWDLKPIGGQDMTAQFQKVVWVREDASDPYSYPSFTPRVTPVASADFHTAPDGTARLAFTPPDAGTYQLEVSSDGTRTQALVWVSGSSEAVWPNLPNNRIQITADKEQYKPGDTATIFIPNPFDEYAQVLLTVERDEILRHDVLILEDAGEHYSLPLSDQDAPNIYVSVTIIGQGFDGRPDFRQGYLNLLVEPVSQMLDVTLTASAESLGPGDDASFTLSVKDPEGKPVQGEFSVAVVDQGVLALADPNSVEILPAFYDQQPLGIRTGMSLVVYAHRRTNLPAGLGGGGDQALAPVIRQDFPGTAYWNAEVVTDSNGEAVITIPLPDNLTTWEVNLRGLSKDTLVGGARAELVVTKDLLVRPVTPRFMVVGDHAEVAAVVHNNTLDDLQVEVSLISTGFTLDDPQTASQKQQVSAGGRLRVSWQGTVEDVTNLDMVFSASSGEYLDSARSHSGGIPVLSYTAHQTFSTAGILDLEEERLEIISLPRTFVATGGALQVEASPSLAAAMMAGLDVLEHNPYPGTEHTLSRFLPNLMTYRVIQDLGLESPGLLARLERTLDEGIQDLNTLQNPDGGWGWWPGNGGADAGEPLSVSNTYLTAYVVFGLSQASDAGAFVDENILQSGVDYLQATRPVLEMLSSTWQLDQLAFHYFSLAQAGAGTAGAGRNLFEVRDQLSPYATAFLALTLASYDLEDERVDTLLSDLEGESIHTGTGIHWEGAGYKTNLDTPMYNTAAAVYALAQLDPASFLLPEAVRYLVSHRLVDGSWGSTYETAWTIMALTQVMKGTGELAGDFSFSAAINGSPLLDGQAGGDTRLNPVGVSIPVSDLYPDDPNGLSIQRTSGPGRLYYAAHLMVMRPAAQAAPISQGINLSRGYDFLLNGGQAGTAGSLVTVKVSLVLENDAYFLVLDDYIPAGAEILDTGLKTSQSGIESVDPSQPYKDGWGWWYFNQPQILTDHITWTADYLPAGTYELTYTLVLIHPGEYQVLPAKAWEFYFPEVQGSSSGEVFVIGE